MRLSYAKPGILLIVAAVFIASGANADEYDSRYFDGLRQRGLHALAEGVLTRQLLDTTLTEREQQELVLELSMTYADHASTKFDNADVLWKQAIAVIDTFLDKTISEQIHAECEVQRGVVITLQGIHYYRLSELLGGDDQHKREAKKIFSEAIKALTTSQVSLNELLERLRPTRLSTARLRGLLGQTSFQLANAQVHQAILQDDNLVEKSNAILQAIRLLTPLVEGSPDDVVTGQSQIVFAKALRIKRDGKRLGFFVEKLVKENPSPRFVDQLVAEQVRLLLDSEKPTEAATKLLERQREVRSISDELVFLQVKTLLAMRAMSLAKNDAKLAVELLAQAERIANSLVSRSSGYWPTLAKLTLKRAQNDQNLGPKLAAMVTAAKSAYRNNKIEDAAKLYQQAFDQAVAEKQNAVSFEFGMSAGELFLQLKKLKEAAANYASVEVNSASEQQAAQAHLMRCYVQTQFHSDGTKLSQSLFDEHIQKYGKQPTVGEVYWMQGHTFANEKSYKEAISSFLKVTINHQRANLAIREAARCCLLIEPKSKNNSQTSLVLFVEVINNRITELERSSPSGNVDLVHAKLSIIELQLSRGNVDRTQFEKQLNEIATTASKQSTGKIDAAELDEWLAAKSRATTLRLVNHVFAGHFADAEQLLQTGLQQKTINVLNVLEKIRGMESEDRQQNFAIGKLMLISANALQKSNPKLTAEQQSLVSQAILDAHLRQGNLDKAITSLSKELLSNPKDTQLKMRLAKLMQASGLPNHLNRAITLWRELESTAKPGTETWYDYRLSYAETLIAQGQQNQCRKLIAITKALYPNVPSESLKKRLAEISAELK